PMPFSVSRRRWEDGENKRPNVLGERSWIGVNHVRSGYAYGMTILSDRVVVSGPDDGDRCSERVSRLTLFDPSSLETIASPITYPCAQVLSADPSNETFVAVYFDDGWRAGRFNADGEELLQGPRLDARFSSLRPDVGLVPNWRPADLLRPSNADELWLIMYDSRRDEPRLGSAALVRLDAATLTPIGPPDFLETWLRSYAGALGANGAYALLNDWGLSVGWFTPGVIAPSASIVMGPDTPSRNVYYQLYSLGGDRMLVASQGRAPAIVVGPDAVEQRTTHPMGGQEQIVTTFVPWQGSIYLGIGIQTINQGKREVIATLFDAANDRFLPGVWVIGEGMASFVQTDAQGRYFIILPWTAEIIRLDPLR
ncbi:MAG: hypothetical protein AAF449_07055, partial [Myxococcota bacterium]